ncbi:hypothetical protein J8J40_35305, partial [Mycobacterium tuberculosis]|nr:hypothetical protein [Mycobacterium tuberculosis]
MSARLDAAVAAGFAEVEPVLKAGDIPGAVIGVVDLAGGRAVRFRGLAQRVPVERPLNRATVFDLASL